jgi:hypothetical protein
MSEIKKEKTFVDSSAGGDHRNGKQDKRRTLEAPETPILAFDRCGRSNIEDWEETMAHQEFRLNKLFIRDGTCYLPTRPDDPDDPQSKVEMVEFAEDLKVYKRDMNDGREKEVRLFAVL